MLRRLFSKAVAIERSIPAPAITRVLHSSNYCTSSNVSESEELSQETESSFCTVSMLGRVGSKPELFQGTPNNIVNVIVGTFNTNENQWHTVKVMQPNTQKWVMNYLNVGDRVLVKGNLLTRYKNDSVYTNIVADEIIVLSKSMSNAKRNEESSED